MPSDIYNSLINNASHHCRSYFEFHRKFRCWKDKIRHRASHCFGLWSLGFVYTEALITASCLSDEYPHFPTTCRAILARYEKNKIMVIFRSHFFTISRLDKGLLRRTSDGLRLCREIETGRYDLTSGNPIFFSRFSRWRYPVWTLWCWEALNNPGIHQRKAVWNLVTGHDYFWAMGIRCMDIALVGFCLVVNTMVNIMRMCRGTFELTILTYSGEPSHMRSQISRALLNSRRAAALIASSRRSLDSRDSKCGIKISFWPPQNSSAHLYPSHQLPIFFLDKVVPF